MYYNELVNETHKQSQNRKNEVIIMSAAVETMYYVGRETPWHGLGTSVAEAPTSLDAIHYAGLDWKVQKQPVINGYTNEVIPNFFATTRMSDGKTYGMVSNKYQIIQNDEAFSFMDNLLGEGVKYETAGSLFEGKKIWMLARLPEDVTILGDKVQPYVVLTNSHDGKSAVQVACTPIRVVCNNTLNMALEGAQRTWSARHVGDVQGKMLEAERTLGLAKKYMEQLNAEAEKMATTELNPVQLSRVVSEVFPITADMTDRRIASAEDDRRTFYEYYNRDDIQGFKNTLYGAILAITDFVDHAQPGRVTKNFNENRFNNIITGYNLADKFTKTAMAIAA